MFHKHIHKKINLLITISIFVKTATTSGDFLDGTKKRRLDWVSSCAPTELISSFRDGVSTRQGQRVRGVSTIRAERAKGVAVARGLADRNTVRSSFTRAPGVPFFISPRLSAFLLFIPSSTFFLSFVSLTSVFHQFCFFFCISRFHSNLAAMLQWLRLINRPKFPTMKTSLFS